MTFNLNLNADTLFDNAYLSLLANTFYYLIFLDENEWRNKIIDKIFVTYNLEYSDSNYLKQYIKTFQETPQLAMVTDHPDCPTKCEDLVKPIFVLFYLLNEKVLTLENNQELLETIFSRIFIEYFGRLIVNLPEETKLKNFYSLENEKEIQQQVGFGKNLQDVIQDIILPKLGSFYTLFELRNAISEEIQKLSKACPIEQIQVKLLEDKLFMNFHKVKLPQLEILYELVMKKPLDKNNYLFWLNHAFSHRNSYERNIEAILMNEEQILKLLKTTMLTDIFTNNKALTEIYDTLSEQFNQMMTKTHLFIYPHSAATIKQKLLKLGQPEFNLNFTVNSFLLRNACLAENCPFYLKESNQLSLHLESNLLRLPALHKAMKMYPKANPQQIIEKAVNGECLDTHLKLPIITEEMKQFFQDPANYKEISSFIQKGQAFYYNHHDMGGQQQQQGKNDYSYKKNYDYYFGQQF